MKGIVFIAVFSIFSMAVAVTDASRMRVKPKVPSDHSESDLPSVPSKKSDEPVRGPVSLPKPTTVVKSDDPVEEVVQVPVRLAPVPTAKQDPVEVDAPHHHQEEEPAQIIPTVVDHHPKSTLTTEADHLNETHQSIAEDAPKKESGNDTDDHPKEHQHDDLTEEHKHDNLTEEHQHDTPPAVGRSLFKLESPAVVQHHHDAPRPVIDRSLFKSGSHAVQKTDAVISPPIKPASLPTRIIATPTNTPKPILPTTDLHSKIVHELDMRHAPHPSDEGGDSPQSNVTESVVKRPSPVVRRSKREDFNHEMTGDEKAIKVARKLGGKVSLKSRLRSALKLGKKFEKDTTTTTTTEESSTTAVLVEPKQVSPSGWNEKDEIIFDVTEEPSNRPLHYVSNFLRFFQSLLNFLAPSNVSAHDKAYDFDA